MINADYYRVYCPFKVEIPLTSVNFSVISVFHLQHNILWSQSPIIYRGYYIDAKKCILKAV